MTPPAATLPVGKSLLRWRVLAAAVGMMVCIGTAYSWSLFERPLMALFGWTSLQVSLAFAIMIFGVGTGAFVGGLFVDRFGARRIGTIGTAMWGLGSLFAGLGTAHFGLYWLYLTYGLIGGLGGGMAYVVPGSTVTKWFPQHRGLVNGVVLFAFGIGSLLYNNVVDLVPHFKDVANAANEVIVARNIATQAGHPFALTPTQRISDIAVVMNVFSWSGVVLTVVGVVSALGLAVPPQNARIGGPADRHEYPWREMVRTSAFYLIWAMVFIDCFSGLAILGNAVPIYSELTGAGAATATVVYGWLSIFNGVGRLLWAAISDAIGRLAALAAAFGLQAAAILALAWAHQAALVMVAFAFMLMCFGGILAIAPAITADYYGTRFLGEDYGCVITAVAFSGLAGPVLFNLLEDLTGSLTHAIIPVAALVALSATLPALVKKPAAQPLKLAASESPMRTTSSRR